MGNRFLTKTFWKEGDKQFHFIACFAITFIIGIVLFTSTIFLGLLLTSLETILISLVSGIYIGWFKEIYDGTGAGTKEIHDIDADILGSTLACVAMFFIFYLGSV